jgi:putative restriction endonuclease
MSEVEAHPATRRFWWVNQNQTHREEIAGGFMWSPKTNSAGAKNQFYDNMRAVEPGDIVFSYYGTRIQAIGVATERAETARKPDFGPAGQSNNWAREGWLVGVEYTRLDRPFRPKDHIEQIRPLLPGKYSPLRSTGDGLQSVYLAEIPEDLANMLGRLGDSAIPSVPLVASPEPLSASIAEEEAQLANLQGRSDIGEAEKRQLIKARRGQGIFRTNVRMNESHCRVTGIADPAHLRASHIKPWKDCSDAEKLHGCNGLLLAPHIDHLFDRGWISFTNEGNLLVTESLNTAVLRAWSIPESFNAGSFSPLQKEFLAFHREHVFRTDAP